MEIYLSFSPRDMDKAELVADRLPLAGHQVLIHSGRIDSDSWADQVKDGVEKADWVVALISPASSQSARVQRELLWAKRTGKRILPVMIASTDLPLLLAEYEYIDISANVTDGVAEINQYFEDNTKAFQQSELRDTTSSLEETHRGSEQLAFDAKKILKEAPLDRVFIAYSRRQHTLAKDIYDLLTANGKAVFYDAKIKAGASWRQTVQRALDDATHVIVIWTPDAAESDEVEREVSYALAEGKVIIPILSQEIPKLPYHLHGLNYIVLDDDLNSIEEALLKAIEQFTEEEDIWE